MIAVQLWEPDRVVARGKHEDWLYAMAKLRMSRPVSVAAPVASPVEAKIKRALLSAPLLAPVTVRLTQEEWQQLSGATEV